jgi:hypothetical protein
VASSAVTFASSSHWSKPILLPPSTAGEDTRVRSSREWSYTTWVGCKLRCSTPSWKKELVTCRCVSVDVHRVTSSGASRRPERCQPKTAGASRRPWCRSKTVAQKLVPGPCPHHQRRRYSRQCPQTSAVPGSSLAARCRRRPAGAAAAATPRSRQHPPSEGAAAR